MLDSVSENEARVRLTVNPVPLLIIANIAGR
jgi:hypothetical protein